MAGGERQAQRIAGRSLEVPTVESLPLIAQLQEIDVEVHAGHMVTALRPANAPSARPATDLQHGQRGSFREEGLEAAELAFELVAVANRTDRGSVGRKKTGSMGIFARGERRHRRDSTPAPACAQA